MNNGISGLKNIIWAFAIVVSLAALIIGLIVTMVLGYNGEAPDGTLYLGDSGSSGLGDIFLDDSGIDGGQTSSGGVMELPSSERDWVSQNTIYLLNFLRSFIGIFSFNINFVFSRAKSRQEVLI